VETLSEQIGVLGESGRIDAAVAVAREALPVMRCMPKFRFEPYACAAALAAGQAGGGGASARAGGCGAQPREGTLVNEGRIAAATEAGLRTILAKKRLAAEMALGEGLGWLDVCALLADAVLAPAPQARDSTGRPSVDVVS
jgi:hypothetical protein